MEAVEKTKSFAREAWDQGKKVSWPSRKELIDSTVLVIITVIIIAFMVGIIDRAFSALVELIL